MKIRILTILSLLIIISLTMGARFLSGQSNSTVELPSLAQWNTYTSTKYHFSINYPPDWKILEVPTSIYQTDIDQVWFTGSSFPPPQTGARADIVLFINEDDPTGIWQPHFFNNYKTEEILLGNVPAIKISGTNKESLYDEMVVIAKIGDYYLHAIPNLSPDSIEYFDRVISSLQVNTSGTNVSSPSMANEHHQAAKIKEIAFEGVVISYDTLLVEDVIAQTIPSFTDPSGFTYNDIPEHIRFDFVNPYTNQEPHANFRYQRMPWFMHQNLEYIDIRPQIFIFPTRDFADISQLAGDRIEALKELLNAVPLSSDVELPVLPLFNSTQDLRAQVQHLEFHGGSGIRFITRYTQEAIPVTNPTVFYTFQGLTGDGEYYVSAFFPVCISSLPDRIEIEDWDAFNRQYQTYLKGTTESLQELRPVDFEPDLAQLDALIQSITILPATYKNYPPPATFTSKSASIHPHPEPSKKVANTPYTATAQPSCHHAIFDPIAFLPDNTRLIARTNTGIHVLNLETLEEESVIESPAEVVEAAISNDGQTLALAFSNHTIQLYHTIQLSGKQLINTLEAHTNFITALKFSPAGETLFSASHDNWVKIWDREGKLIKSFLPSGGEVLGIGVSPDGAKLAAISFEGPMKLWDIRKNQVIQEFESPYGAFDGAEAAFSADGQIVARGIGGGPITLYKVSDGTQLWSGGVYALAFSPDGRFLAISDIDEDGENIIVLRSQDGTQAHMILRGHHSIILKLIFSPDSSVLASVDDLEFKIWQVEDGQLLYSRSSTCP